MIERIVRAYRDWRYREPPLPRIGVRAGVTVPGWALRVAAALCLAGGLWLSMLSAGAPVWPWGVFAAAAFVLALRLADYRIALSVILLAAVLLLETPPLDLGPLIALACFAGFRLSQSAALLPWTGRAQLSVVLGWRDAVIAGLTVLTWLVPRITTAGAWAGVAGLVGLAGLALLVIITRPPRRLHP